MISIFKRMLIQPKISQIFAKEPWASIQFAEGFLPAPSRVNTSPVRRDFSCLPRSSPVFPVISVATHSACVISKTKNERDHRSFDTTSGLRGPRDVPASQIKLSAGSRYTRWKLDRLDSQFKK